MASSGPQLLHGGVAFITGAASGIGEACGFQFAKYGAAALVLCDINLPAQEKVGERIRLAYPKIEVQVLHIDTSKEDSILEAHAAAIKRFGRIDYAVNNAGVGGIMKPSTELTLEEFKYCNEINMLGVWIGQREQLKLMLKQEPLAEGASRGTIVNISSIYGIVCGHSTTSYGAGKHAVLGITRNDACNFAKQGIRVNAVCPGYTDTAIINLENDNAALMVNEYLATVPMGRLGKPDEIANTIVFLSSTMSSYITGGNIMVDGGFLCV